MVFCPADAIEALPNLILFPASDVEAQRNLELTVRRKVPLSRIERLVRKSLLSKLGPYEYDLCVWGISPSRFNTHFWKRFEKNDLCAFLVGDEFVLAGRVLTKTNSKVVADALWGSQGGLAKWNLVTFVRDVHRIHVPLARFVRDAGFRSGYSTHKTIIVTEDPVEKLLDKYGSIEGSVGFVPTSFTETFWRLMHPAISRVAKQRFSHGQYADSVEAAMKTVNLRVKHHHKTLTGVELDGADLMHTSFSPNNPIILLDNPATRTGRDVQQGYMEVFAGAMTGVRNPKAHGFIRISPERAIHFLFLASLLMFKLDDARVPKKGYE
jgi:uncharacterized protein (TIGR02391 family)